MPRKFVQDVVPISRRSIRNIPLPNNKSQVATGVNPTKRTERVAPEKTKVSLEPRQAKIKRNSGITSTWWFWAASAAAVLVVVYVGSFAFVSAKITVVPRSVTVPLDLSIEAQKEPTEEGLSYSIVTLSREAGKEVMITGEETVETRASGRIVIYNDYGDSPQTLINNTRFRTHGGLIFRIREQISVPGRRTVNGVTTPGSLTVTVYADEPGDRYNVGLSDFTIPGFEGDPRFSRITAKSDPGSPIGGGFSGTIGQVSETDKSSAKISIESQLRNELRQALASQIPNSHVLFNTASVFGFEEMPQEPGSSANTAVLKEKGTIHGVIFDRDELSKFLADRLIEGESGSFHVANLDTLSFSIEGMEEFRPETEGEIVANLKGEAEFVWNIDQDQLKEALAGKKKAEMHQVFSQFISIDQARASIIPLWIRSFPADKDKIHIEINREI